MAILAMTGILLAILGMWARATSEPQGLVMPEVQPLPKSYRNLSLMLPKIRVAGVKQKTFHGVSSCNISAINGVNFDRKVAVSKGMTIGVGGWMADRVNRDVPEHAWLILAMKDNKEAYQVPVLFRTRRPDVQRALGGNSSYAYTGFISNFESRGLRPGVYHLYIVFKGGETFYTCDNGRYFSITPGDSSAVPLSQREPT